MSDFYIVKDQELKKYEEIFTKNDIVIPTRKTFASSGYDFSSPYELSIKPHSVEKIYTGIKANLNEDEFLMIVVRSSIGINKGIVLANQVGIIDSDYYNNESNDGHIIIALRNMTDETVLIKKGERVCQGIIQKYYKTESDNQTNKRIGGFGSTGK